ncbi:MAG: type II toxin-antitoxin system HipA family toxin [Betaproteobacteria bacterium]|nr:type II toxin-antitoxin system HipA family toxin [Betaproteobacteria bacterium]
MKQLDVYVGPALAGYLRERDDGVLAFAYAPQWIQGGSAAALAPDLALQAGEHAGDVVLAYFDNLLPEGSVRDFIARAEHISAANVFGLLERFGGDTAGAISLLPQGQRPPDAPRYRPVDVAMIRECFATSRGIPLGIGGEQVRMSLSGAQDKMTVFIGADGGMALPLGNAPTSHIIKPTMGYRPDLPQTAVNEALVMRLAQAVRLDVPDVRYDTELDAVVIARYDRAFDAGGQLRRLHQNDLCQIMGVPSGRKYEAEGGPSLKACFAAVGQHSSQPALDKKRLIEWVVFNVAVGNMDSHAKNLSMLVGADDKTRLAPFYDMVCTTAYPRLSGKFAFKVGGESRPGWIMDRHWGRFAEEIEAKPQFVNKIRLDTVERIERALPVVANELRETVRHADGLSMIDCVEAEVRRFTGRLRARAAATPDAEHGTR